MKRLLGNCIGRVFGQWSTDFFKSIWLCWSIGTGFVNFGQILLRRIVFDYSWFQVAYAWFQYALYWLLWNSTYCWGVFLIYLNVFFLRTLIPCNYIEIHLVKNNIRTLCINKPMNIVCSGLFILANFFHTRFMLMFIFLDFIFFTSLNWWSFH